MWRTIIVGFLLSVAFVASLTTPAWVQGPGGLVGICYGPPTACQRVDTGTPLPVTITGGSGATVSQAKTAAAASSLVAKAGAGSLVSISGSAANGSYIMLFNATSAPADGAVTPDKCWGPMSTAGPFAFGWGPSPFFVMSAGITVVSSSTGCFTKTATNAAFLAAEYQ